MSNADVKRIIFFADTHLSPAQPAKTKFVIDFLNCQPKDTSFYILGDFFDIWIGPAHIKLPDYAEILKELKKLTGSGVEINLIPGNRDYMVGPELTRATGVMVLTPVFILNLSAANPAGNSQIPQSAIRNPQSVMLTHGDLLCTDDTRYQGYRRLVQSRIVKSVGKSLPGSVGKTFGKELQNNFSSEKAEHKVLPSKNIVPATVKRYLKQSDAIICGHIHRSSQTRFNDKQLIVVGDWSNSPSWVEYTDTEGLVLK